MADDEVRVTPEDLVESGSHVDIHANSMYAQHTQAHGRIESAQTGWTGQSAAAMSAKAAEWQATTTALFARLTDHAETFRSSALRYQTTENESGRALDEAGTDTRAATAD